MKKLLLFPLYIMVSTLSLFSQELTNETKMGVWSEMGVEKKINRWTIGGVSELRTSNFLSTIDRWNVGVFSDFAINEYLKMGLGYDFMHVYDRKYNNYQFRHRLNGALSGKLKVGHITFALRERVQTTFKDDSKRIKKNGKIDKYAVNPEWRWRNRLKVSYDIPKSKFTPFVSAETHYELNNPKGNTFDTFRYILGTGYKINKHNIVDVYGVLNDKRDKGASDLQFRIGLSYLHKLK